jgi:glutamate racemase
MKGAIGVFDSGYGGLTVLKELINVMPNNNYLYLGDNARAPYGNRSFATVHQYTLQCVQWFFKMECPLVILACNTASAKALRNIQQNYLPNNYPHKKVLGVLRPTTEIIGNYSASKNIGILATQGTVNSNSYPIEIHKFFSDANVYQQACPMLVPLIENNEHNSPAALYFIEQYVNQLLQQNNKIDTILLACTHYPLIANSIKKYVANTTKIITQGSLVANSLQNYLQRHSEVDSLIAKEAKVDFFTTDDTNDFDKHGSLFFGASLQSKLALL